MFVNQSKQEESKILPFNKLLENPDNRERVLLSDIQKAALHNLPLNDPNRKSFDFSTINFMKNVLTI
jgi:hypothetical protein